MRGMLWVLLVVLAIVLAWRWRGVLGGMAARLLGALPNPMKIPADRGGWATPGD
jgi:hypothetical protein